MTYRARPGWKAPRGFTLIELGVVLGVSAILAAAILPDFIEAARGKMAEKAAADIAVIQDAARWSFVQSLTGAPATRGRWPGQANPQACNMTTDGIDFMVAQGYLTTAPQNPWGFDYEVGLVTGVASGGGISSACVFQVSTEVPKAISRELRGMLPLGQCSGETGLKYQCKGTASSPDNVLCCSFIPKPGTSVSPCPPGMNPSGPVNGSVTCS